MVSIGFIYLCISFAAEVRLPFPVQSKRLPVAFSMITLWDRLHSVLKVFLSSWKQGSLKRAEVEPINSKTIDDEVLNLQKQLEETHHKLQASLSHLQNRDKELTRERQARLQIREELDLNRKELMKVQLQLEASVSKDSFDSQSQNFKTQLQELLEEVSQERIERIEVEQAKKNMELAFESRLRDMQCKLDKALESLSELLDDAPEEERMLSVLRRMWGECVVLPQPQEIKLLDVTDLGYTHDTIAQKFRDGRLLECLVEDLHAGRVIASKHPNLLLDVVIFNGKYRCLNNRRLWALKKYQKDLKLGAMNGKRNGELSKPTSVRARIFNLCPITAKFVLSNTTCTDGADAEVRRSCSRRPRSVSCQKSIPTHRRASSRNPADRTATTHASEPKMARRWDHDRQARPQVFGDNETTTLGDRKQHERACSARGRVERDTNHRPSGDAAVWVKYQDPATSKHWWWNESEQRVVWEDPVRS